MSDLNLLKKFQVVDINHVKANELKLLQLKSRIETDMFLLELNSVKGEMIHNVIGEHLQLVTEAINLYRRNELTAEHMKKINKINRIYKR